MLLERLDITVNGKVVRSVPFEQGLNFIVDRTISKGTTSGNSVGKTTVLRVIDYCLGSRGEDIYKDTEFKSELNWDVYNFLKNNDVVATLVIRKDNGSQLVLVRDITDEPKLFKINGEEHSKLKSYTDSLRYELFKLPGNKPTLRQLVPKFIRSDGHRMSNALRFLHSNTSDSEYETLHLTMFGFENLELLNDKQKLTTKFNRAKKRYDALKQGTSLNALQQSLKVVERDIADQEAKIEDFQIGNSYIEEGERLKAIQRNVADLAVALSERQQRAGYIEESLNELKKNKAQSDSEAIRQIYEEASRFVIDLQATFESTLDFHNKMISRKVKHLEGRLSKLLAELKEIKIKLNKEAARESELLRSISATGTLNDLRVMNDRLNELYESKGQKQQAIDQLSDAAELMERLEDDLSDVCAEISSNLESLDRKLYTFNKDFSALSKLFYDEEYVVSYDEVKGKIKFSISNVDGNVGGGKKKGQVAAFDIAYISFVAQMGMSAPRFVLHDSVEDVHNNQLGSLFEYAAKFEGQYVISVLSEKIKNVSTVDVETHVRLELDQDDRFFKI